jgi:hypothetical protein
MKKRLYRDLAKRSPGRASSEQKHLVAERSAGTKTNCMTNRRAKGLAYND